MRNETDAFAAASERAHLSLGEAAAGGAALLASGVALAAQAGVFGGAGSSAGTLPSAAVTVQAAAVTEVEASRFLAQATNGATRASINRVVSLGFDGWISDQMAMRRGTSHWDWLVARGQARKANNGNQAAWDASIWRQLIAEPDQLRQRVALALLDILVVSLDGIVNTGWRHMAMAAYMDTLLDHAFGNYRALLGAVTRSVAMASFLTYLNKAREDLTTGGEPDENYARELMQLFTIGLYQLEMDGTVRLSAGKPIETYTTQDVTQLARVFTGVTIASNDNTTADRLRRPLVVNESLHESGGASFLGATVSGAGSTEIDAALDVIFAHPNVPPFVSKALIQRLVTSNPSPGYVRRVASVFANNGSGVRGDMAAVVRAILLDMEARDLAALTSTTAGKLRDPIQRFTGWARAFGASSPSGAWAIGDLSNPTNRLGQSPGRSPSVFNFFRPGYTPPNSAVASAGLVAPEFQITNEQSVVGFLNFMENVVAIGVGDVKADYTYYLGRASNSTRLVDEINLVLAAGQLSEATKAAIRTAVDSVGAASSNGPMNRVGVAIMLTLGSPDYLILK